MAERNNTLQGKTTGNDTVPPAPVENKLSTLTSTPSKQLDTSENKDIIKETEQRGQTANAENRNAPAGKKDISAISIEEKLLQVREQIRNGVATPELLKLEEELSNQQQKQPNDASLRKLDDQDKSPEDVKRESFKEGDVIDYMYNHWLIDGALYLDEKVRKYGFYYYTQLREAVQDGAKERQIKREKIEKSKGVKAMKEIDGIYKNKIESIAKETNQKEQNINKISVAIKSGTLFDDENKELLQEYEKIIGADTQKGQEQLATTRAACEAYKENPQDKEAALGAKKIAAEFARDAKLNAGFDMRVQMSALNITAANMLDQVTFDASKYKNIEASFDNIWQNNVTSLKEATTKDREQALKSAAQKDAVNAAAMNMGMHGTAVISATEKAWERNLSTFNQIDDSAQKCIKKSKKHISRGETAEFGITPEKSEELENINRLIIAKKHWTKFEEQSEQKQEKREQTETTAPVVEDEKPQTLIDSAKRNVIEDKKIAEDKKRVESNPRIAEVAAREQAHEERGQKINPRIEALKARAMASKEAKRSGAEFMVDEMFTNGNLSEKQKETVLNAAIQAEEKNGKEASANQVLNGMRESGQFSQEQIKTARNINFAYESTKQR